MIRSMFAIVLMLVAGSAASAEELYVNSKMGNDTSSGTRSQPLRTISEAARRANGKPDKAGATIILSAGVHVLTETVLFNNRKYTSENRLVIRAELMPDNAGWNPQAGSFGADLKAGLFKN